MNFARVSPLWAAIAIVVVALGALALSASATRLLNCDMECGETLLAFRAAHQFAAHGVEFGLLENVGTRDAPLIYTHNVNIGSLSYVALEALGVPDQLKPLLPLFVHGIGLLYVYLTVQRVSGDGWLGVVTLGVFATCYWGLGAFALNGLRAWHLLAFFAVVFHTLGIISRVRSRAELCGLTFGAVAAFGCGYDFWIICGAMSGMLVLAAAASGDIDQPAGRSWLWRVPWRHGALIAATFAVPFLARQLHVASVMGASFWARDVYYSLGIKVPYAGQLLGIPPLAEIDAFYAANHVLRPPAQPSNSAAQILNTLQHMITSVTVPRWGWLSLVAWGGLAVLAAFRLTAWSILDRIAFRVLLPMSVGIALGLAIFAPFSLHVYLKHEFPLVAFPLLMAKAAIVYWLIANLTWRRVLSPLLAVGLVLIVLDGIMVHWNNNRHGPALNYAWTRIFREVPDDVGLSTYKVFAEADPFLGIETRRAVYATADDMLSGRLPHINYWVYQPVDQFVDFDSARPRCGWTGWYRQITGWKHNVPHELSCIYGYRLADEATASPSLDEMTELAKYRFELIERGDRGIGYVVFKRRAP